jgi:hypothetical protein
MARANAIKPPDSKMPTRLTQAWLGTRIVLLRGRRAVRNLQRPVPLLRPAATAGFIHRVAIHRSPLRTATDPLERPLESGKVQNLRVAARRLDGLIVPAGATFSFWRQLGRCTRASGYVDGRQLQEGCLVPAVGGGICQLSNALYDVALQAGCDILERHPHTRVIPGSAASRDRDATVAWNHIDLRWSPPFDLRLSVHLTADELVVELRSTGSSANPSKERRTLRQWIDPDAHSCGTCERTECHLFDQGIATRAATGVGQRTAVLVDEVWPEFDLYLQAKVGRSVELFLPLDGARRNRPNYGWSTDGYGSVHEAKVATLKRSLRSRRLAEQGAARQAARLGSLSELADAYAKRLRPEVTHVVVCLDLLPFLWRGGHLGGRTFEVLMTRFPMAELQGRLDAALGRHPERRLLGDFRAPGDLIHVETEALAAAERLVTPHRAIAADDTRRVLLDWVLPPKTQWRPGKRVIFPGPVVARKGAYEVRDAAAELGLTVVSLGRNLEGEGFWADVATTGAGESPFEGALAVVQPAVLEDRPRKLLQAIASGCPVIATEACGVAGMPGVTLIPEGDSSAVRAALVGLLTSRGDTA